MPKILYTLALIFTITLNSYSQEGWIWQNPLPQGNNMSDLQFVNSTTAFAMCYNSVMRSTNAGNNWNIFYTLQDQNNASMNFVNANTGFIVCDTGLVLKTINGGVNWNVEYDFNDKKFHRIYFQNINTGYAIKFNEYIAGSETSLYRTTNGGTSWNTQINDSGFILSGIDFPVSQTGYLAGYARTSHPNTFLTKFFRSTNSGVSWDSVSNPMYSKFYGCKFIDANTGFAYGERVFSTYKSLYKTTNGGTNWIPTDITARIFDINTTDPNSILVISTNQNIYRSTNIGLNWLLFSQFPYFHYGSTTIFSIKSTDNNTILGTGSNGQITKSTNAGLNWNSHFNNNNSSWFWGVDFVNENTGFAVDQANLLKTTNGGTNWNSVLNRSLYHMDFVDANTGYCGGVDSLFKTTNGGLTFSQIHYTNAPYILNEIQFLNANTGFLLGKYKTTWKTTNGGDNWNILTGYGSGYHECLFFYNESLGFIGREDHNLGWGVSRTTNGGLNWDFQPFANVDYVLDFYFTSNVTGYFTTRDQIFKTTNTGNNWFSVFEPNIFFDIYAIQFVNNNIGYASFANGKFVKTTDAGNTWQIHNSITNYGFFDLCFTDVNTGYFVGSGGVILKTTNGGGSPIGIEPFSNNIPNEFKLHQNYPNPFNPVTKIKFFIPAGNNGMQSETVLTIYDILGKEISVLLNDILSPGEYQIEWNALNYPSGVYFYTLLNGGHSETGKMLLLK